MSLFGLGKKKEDEKKVSSVQTQQMINIPSLPEFPSLDDEDNASGFPKYEPTMADIKKEVGRGDDDLSIPVRNRDFSGKRMASMPVSEHFPSEASSPMGSVKRFSMGEDKPLFVKIDSYKQAMHTLDALKAKLEDAEDVLKAFEDIKAQEDDKLEAWKRDLQNMKDKLFSIDKELFEV